MSDASKRLVLARRARFVAAAVAGIAVACGKEKAPAPCLEVTAAPSDAASPEPCLSVFSRDLDAAPAPPATEPPRPCLSIAPRRDAGARKDCDPPFVIGPDGVRRYKPECL